MATEHQCKRSKRTLKAVRNVKSTLDELFVHLDSDCVAAVFAFVAADAETLDTISFVSKAWRREL